MGFMGLSSWIESDGAADLRYVLQEQFDEFNGHKDEQRLTTDIRQCVDVELKDMANFCNTPGYVNLALVLEDEGDPGNEEYEDPGLPVFSKFLTIPQLRRASRLFLLEIPKWNTEHQARLKELHKVIIKLLKSKRAKL